MDRPLSVEGTHPLNEAPVLDREALLRAWREAEATKALDAETSEDAP